MRAILSFVALGLLGGGGFACLYAFISFTDPQFRNRRHGYIYSAVGACALVAFVALWRSLR